jgi:hypothetical protein
MTPDAKWSVIVRRIAITASSSRNANSPSANTIAGRSAGMASTHDGSSTDAATDRAPSRAGSTASRSAITAGRSTLIHSTVSGGSTLNTALLNPAPTSTTTPAGCSATKVAIRSSSIFARKATSATTLGVAPKFE